PRAPSPRNSSVPLLSETKPADDSSEQPGLLAKGKRKILALGKKKEPEKSAPGNGADMPPPAVPTLHADHLSSASAMRPVSPLHSPQDHRASPRGSPRIYPANAASPSRRYRSSSPGLHSPASSQIFERNVQENTLAGELSPAIPAHIQTEDHIPPVLEASSLAITDDHLNPDEVEIVMHSAHQPASASVVGGGMSDSLHSPLQDDFFNHQDTDDTASNYGSLDTTDVRRLSFISFADVVQAEHAENNRDATHLMSLSSTATNRSPSPVRSPTSSHGFSVSPPTSGAASVKGLDLTSKGARVPGSPTTAQGAQSPPLGGELTIETMRQALRKTGSGDLSGARSQPMSAVSLDDSTSDLPPFK
ncbi:hypothetical protein BU16DRAFT_436135, partial [Lophium mytilinum]